MWSEKSTRRSSFVDALMFFLFSCKCVFMAAFTIFPQTWDHIFKTVVFCFLLLTLGCLKTCVNCVTKLITAKIYLMEVQILSLSNLCFKVNFLLVLLGFQKNLASIRPQKSRIREIPTLSTDADNRTDKNLKRLHDL